MDEAAIIWFTGLSGAGKTTISKRVFEELKRRGVRSELLDGDLIRDLFPRTGFSRADRDMHIRRIGFLASLLEKHGVVVVAAFISPYAETRKFVRKLSRNYIEVFLSTPLAICEKRDVKGLYAKARRGEIKNFTGIDDPYEAPDHPEVEVDTSDITVEECVRRVLSCLERKHPSGAGNPPG